MPLQCQVITDSEELSRIKDEWDALTLECSNIPIFQNWAWVDAWLSCFQARPWILLVRSSTGNLLGIAPLMLEIKRSVRTLRFVSAGMVQPDHLDIICSEAMSDAVLQKIADYLQEHAEQWDVLDFEGVAENAKFPNYFDQILGHGLRRNSITCPYVDLAEIENWEQFQKARLSSHMRSKGLRYPQNVLERENPGAVYYERIEDQAELGPALENLIEQHRDRWAVKQTYTPFEDARFLDFHRRFAKIALQQGWLGLYRLRIADQTIATVYGFYYQGRFFDYQHALDNAWSKFSPGRQLISFIIKDCISTQQSEYDFLCGTEQYKYSWTQTVRTDQHIIWSSGVKGAVFKLALSLKDWLKCKIQEHKTKTASNVVKNQ